jgi:hypothetical protein
MTKEKTGTQLNQAYTSVDDFNTIKYVLPLLRDEKTRNRLIEEHRACPVGRASHKGQPMVEHSKDLIRVLDKLRRQPMAGKLLTVCKKPHEDYRIGIASGIRGLPVKILEESFSSEEACEHAIFLKRVMALLEKYGE